MARPEDWISICLDRRDVNIKSSSTRARVLRACGVRVAPRRAGTASGILNRHPESRNTRLFSRRETRVMPVKRSRDANYSIRRARVFAILSPGRAARPTSPPFAQSPA